MMRTIRQSGRLLLFAVILLAGACNAGDGVDVSSEPEFADMIGREYRLVGDVDAYGIKKEDRDEHASYVTLIPPPGISGPEVAFKKRVAKGRTFRILSVRRRLRFLANGNDYLIELNEPDLPAGVEVRIALVRGNESGESGLNPELYQPVSDQGGERSPR